MAFAIIFILLVAVVLFVARPLLFPSPAAASAPGGHPAGLLELEAARDAKLREIRDAELDHQTGKLSDEDYAAVDSTLRTQAIEILDELDDLSDSAEGPGERLR